MKQEKLSLLQVESFHEKGPELPKKKADGLCPLSFFIIVGILAFVLMFIIQRSSKSDQDDHHYIIPIAANIVWPQNKTILMEVSTARVLEALLFSGKDNRSSHDYATVTKRDIQWSVEPKGIVVIDQYGRVEAIKEGTCTIRLTSLSNPDNAKDSRKIKVVKKREDIDPIRKRIVNYEGLPASPHYNLQKQVLRYSQAEVKKDATIPPSVKWASQNPTLSNFQKSFIDSGCKWEIVKFADGSENYYVKRTNSSALGSDRDRVQYFMGDRYLPEDGKSAIMIDTDMKGGAWVVSKKGNTTHIKMTDVQMRNKAYKMSKQTEDYVTRHGLASESYWNGKEWVRAITDNDGLWTSMYGAGELMRYASLKRDKTGTELEIQQARKSALRSLKAVLLISNVSGRKKRVDAKIRHLNNTRIQEGAFYEQEFLKQGKQDIRDVYPGRPADGISFFGLDAGKVVEGDSRDGNFKYSFEPLLQKDWTSNKSEAAAVSERTLEGFISRTFIIPAVDPPVPGGGLFFKRLQNGSQQVLSDAHILYDFTREEQPILNLGNEDIPEVLKQILTVDGKTYNKSDLVYKGDTSTDEVIGHLFIYKIAFDILDESDDEERQLKELIVSTMRKFCQHLVNNGHTMVDATGHATKWAKLTREFFTSDYTIEDAPLKAIQLLMCFKVGYYVTGERKWKEEYEFLGNDERLGYLDLVSMIYDRWRWVFTHEDDRKSGIYKLDYSKNPSEIEIERHVLYNVHFSDEEEAYLAFYLAFQLEEDEEKLKKYRKGLLGYWHSISQSQNPLWYYIRQLADPTTDLKDYYRNVLKDTASWQLSRTPIDCTKYRAYFWGSRSDVIIEGAFTANPERPIGKRTSQHDVNFVNHPENKLINSNFDPWNIYEIKVLPADERTVHKFNGGTFNFRNDNADYNPNQIEAATVFTLPYWMGVYHGMLKPQ